MVPALREKYNREFTIKKYESFIKDLWKFNNGTVDFRVSETPLFIDAEFTETLDEACDTILSELSSESLSKKCDGAIPQKFRIPDEDEHPVFLQLDFGVTKNELGNYIPKLIELQGFPSLYAFQAELSELVKWHYNIDDSVTSYFNGYEYSSYINLFKQTILGESDPENVILLEITPELQKTKIDFYFTEQYTGIKSVCLSDLIQRGNKLFYLSDGIEVPIERIYNRVIFDELERKNIPLNLNFTDALDLKWVGHPNWFFKISKFTLPLLNNKFSPECWYLSDLETYPEDLENYVLKPLFSFAGSGVVIDLDSKILDGIKSKQNFILQQKVNYEPVIKTPDDYAKAEIRMMFIWDKKPILVNNLLRTTKGKMVGVDYNKDKTWIGSNIVFHPK